MTALVLVAAHGRHRELGAGNQLLWHLPEDLAHFKALTLGKPVLMGRKTWESLPPRFRPLPGRRNLVLTRGAPIEGAETVRSLDEALASCACDAELCVIGGAEVYALALPKAKRLELTEVDAAYPQADCHFPPYAAPENPPPWETAASGLRYRFLSLPPSTA
ncbi:MAG: dihydrofolate reductase [Burkholderiales bacterium]|nr:dihydrofolate reductase [Burkholderiales bacterium]